MPTYQEARASIKEALDSFQLSRAREIYLQCDSVDQKYLRQKFGRLLRPQSRVNIEGVASFPIIFREAINGHRGDVVDLLVGNRTPHSSPLPTTAREVMKIAITDEGLGCDVDTLMIECLPKIELVDEPTDHADVEKFTVSGTSYCAALYLATRDFLRNHARNEVPLITGQFENGQLICPAESVLALKQEIAQHDGRVLVMPTGRESPAQFYVGQFKAKEQRSASELRSELRRFKQLSTPDRRLLFKNCDEMVKVNGFADQYRKRERAEIYLNILTLASQMDFLDRFTEESFAHYARELQSADQHYRYVCIRLNALHGKDAFVKGKEIISEELEVDLDLLHSGSLEDCPLEMSMVCRTLAEVAFLSGEVGEALTLVDWSIERNQDESLADELFYRCTKGKLLALAERHEEACTVLEDLYNELTHGQMIHDPDAQNSLPFVTLHLARAYVFNGDQARAGEYLEKHRQCPVRTTNELDYLEHEVDFLLADSLLQLKDLEDRWQGLIQRTRNQGFLDSLEKRRVVHRVNRVLEIAKERLATPTQDFSTFFPRNRALYQIQLDELGDCCPY